MELLTDEEILKKGYNALEQIGGTVKFAFNKFQQIQQLIRSATPQPINQALDALSEGVEYVAGKTPIGVADRGASALGEMVGQATGNELLGQVVGFGAGMAVPGPEISRAAKPVIPKGIKPEVIAQSPTLPPMGPSPAMALASSGGGMTLQKAAPTLEELSAQPLQVISNLQPAQWDKPIRTLIEAGADTKQIARALETPYNKALSTKYKKITPTKLANDKELLQLMLTRADKIRKAFAKGNQRQAYDLASKNIFDAAVDVYNATGKTRDKLRQEVRALFGVRQWHHIFGNKEAGEFLLSTVAQDPVIAVNLFQHMKKLGLSASGIAENMALMKQSGHNSWHRFMEDFGTEPRAKMRSGETFEILKQRGLLGQQQGVGPKYTAPLDVADFGQEISSAIQRGTTSVDELFTFIETYAKFNKWLRNKMKTGSFQPQKKPAPISFGAEFLVDK